MVARSNGTSGGGGMHAMAMASLTPLLLLLWGSQVQAVTLEAPSVLRAAARFAQATPGLTEDLKTEAELGTLDVTARAPAPEPVTTEGGEAGASTGEALRLTQAAARREVSIPTAVSLTERSSMGPWAAQAGLGGLGASAPAPTAAAEADRALGFGRVSMLVLGATQRPEAQPAPPRAIAVRVRWWMALPLLPGLAALVVSMRGLARTRTRRRYVLVQA